MKKYVLLLTLFSLFLIPEVSAKKEKNPKVKNPIDYRFEKGEDGYFEFFGTRAIYPQPSIDSGSVGISITRVAISPQGDIVSLRTVNPIDQYIDREVIQLIESSAGKWKKCDTIHSDQVFYIQIAFTFASLKPSFCLSGNKAFKQMFPDPVVITTAPGGLARKMIPDNSELSIRGNALLEKGDLAGALSVINELIKRDPFNIELYKARIQINSIFNRKDLAAEDQQKIDHFAGELSLQEILDETKARYF